MIQSLIRTCHHVKQLQASLVIFAIIDSIWHLSDHHCSYIWSIIEATARTSDPIIDQNSVYLYGNLLHRIYRNEHSTTTYMH